MQNKKGGGLNELNKIDPSFLDAKIGGITSQMALSRYIEWSCLKITGQIIKTKNHPVEST